MVARRFASVIPSFRGAQIVYGLTIPKNAPHPREAARLIEFLLGPDGRRIFGQCWQPLAPTPVCDNVQLVPETLKSFFHQESHIGETYAEYGPE